MQAELVLDLRAELGNAPAWDAATGHLLCADVMRGVVHEFHPETGSSRAIETGAPVGFAVPASSGDWVLGTAAGLERLDPTTGTHRRMVAIDADRSDNRMNVGAVDPRGRLWAATMSMSGRRHGALYRTDPDGK